MQPAPHTRSEEVVQAADCAVPAGHMVEHTLEHVSELPLLNGAPPARHAPPTRSKLGVQALPDTPFVPSIHSKDQHERHSVLAQW